MGNFPFIDVNSGQDIGNQFDEDDKGDRTYASTFQGNVVLKDATTAEKVSFNTGIASPSETASQVDGVIPNI